MRCKACNKLLDPHDLIIDDELCNFCYISYLNALNELTDMDELCIPKKRLKE